MYMPGRSRTGSSPSRTVMSLAVYVASLIEKALETGRFRALRILPERTVGICLCEAQCSGLCDDFAKVLVLDLGGELLRSETMRIRRFDRRLDRPFRRLERGLGKRSDCKAEPFRRNRSESRANARGELTELERPCRRARVHVQRPVASDPRGPRIARDFGTHGSRPRPDQRREPRGRAEPPQL